jgi:hypothetical protein
MDYVCRYKSFKTYYSKLRIGFKSVSNQILDKKG